MWAMSDSQASSASDTATHGDSESESVSESESEVPVFIPVFRSSELASVQFLSLEEQRFEAEKRVMFQPNRHATACFVDMNLPVQLRTRDQTKFYRRGDDPRVPARITCQVAVCVVLRGC
jgi:hypothetical protein